MFVYSFNSDQFQVIGKALTGRDNQGIVGICELSYVCRED